MCIREKARIKKSKSNKLCRKSVEVGHRPIEGEKKGIKDLTNYTQEIIQAAGCIDEPPSTQQHANDSG